MRPNVIRTIETLLFISLLMPVGMLFGATTGRQFGITSHAANWYDTGEAATLFNQMQGLASKVTEQIGPIQVQEEELSWPVQEQMLSSARADIDKMGSDLLRLGEMKNKLEPWQQSLIHKISPRVHELVYQADAAIAQLGKYHSKTRLATAQYPQNINMMFKNANDMAGTIGTVTQYARAEAKLAALEHHSAKASS